MSDIEIEKRYAIEQFDDNLADPSSIELHYFSDGELEEDVLTVKGEVKGSVAGLRFLKTCSELYDLLTREPPH